MLKALSTEAATGGPPSPPMHRAGRPPNTGPVTAGLTGLRLRTAESADEGPRLTLGQGLQWLGRGRVVAVQNRQVGCSLFVDFRK